MTGRRDPRVDAYIASAQPFARPILTHLRVLVHGAVPDVGEAIKWGMPFFTLEGANLANLAAFKEHAAFGFWRHAEVMGTADRGGAMGSFGRLAGLADLPPDAEIVARLVEAVRLIRDKVPDPRRASDRQRNPDAAVPAALATALAADVAAQKAWNAFAPSHRREYCAWIADAKREETRARRVAQAIEWIAAGRGRNWKYKTG
ncbi:MAG: YdeI/OmpD-associated family protein [Sphingopyxis sp.]|uniref:YdeI/OmpD-associated family protein n=1 Tax=Sphingopyxis sp. TaxID=1908224 RepID=UPI002ABB5319|nr:YdeI/OmpD-associated family protein [Sphingopyxis sp.]MDZ3833020.1 YdeI/OmpD-associated family protein [Sphingopyxis sp.]